MANFFSFFKDLPVAAKLFGGFALLIMIIILSSLTSILQSNNIRDHALKGKLVSEINHELNAARRNRLAYQLSHDEKALQANKIAIDKMVNKAIDGKAFTWDTDARILFDELRDAIPAYASARDEFVKREQEMGGDKKNLTSPKLKTLLDNYSNDLAEREQSTKNEILLLNKLNNVWNTLLVFQSSSGQKEKELFDSELTDLETYIKSENSVLIEQDVTLAQSFVKLAKTNISNYLSSMKQSHDAGLKLTSFAEKINDITTSLVTYQNQNNFDVIQRVMVIMGIVAVCAVVTGLLVAWLLTRQMTSQIKHNLTLAERIAGGDLTAVIEPQSSDELGRLTMAMAAMNDRLREMISQIKESVGHVTGASSDISAGNIDLASRTEEQSAAVVQTAASMEELTSTVKRNAENAREASYLAGIAAEHARSGGKIVGDVVNTMENITESSNKITDIISVINGISFQTNILALNAAVEAARAGEQGRGFAVVAGEVRNLAQRSANAAKEIEVLIKESVQRVVAGSEMANKAGNTMEQIVSSVTNVSGIMSEISDASEEQSRGIDQIGKAVTELDSTTQQNAALVQESSAAASSLEQQANQLAQLVSLFRISTESSDEKLKSTPKGSMSTSRTAVSTSNGNSWESF